uniref:Cathelicidin antimicrobial peptide n=1 Tax=Nothoprocta perdicaria TaxID=30464 RepID=A0A8C6ZV48_NOTPE
MAGCWAVDAFNLRPETRSAFRLLSAEPEPSPDVELSSLRGLNFTLMETECEPGTRARLDDCDFKENGAIKECTGSVLVPQGSPELDLRCVDASSDVSACPDARARTGGPRTPRGHGPSVPMGLGGSARAGAGATLGHPGGRHGAQDCPRGHQGQQEQSRVLGWAGADANGHAAATLSWPPGCRSPRFHKNKESSDHYGWKRPSCPAPNALFLFISFTPGS